MVLEEYRKQADPYLNPIAAYFVHTHPNTMTWLAFVFAVLAGLTFIATNFLGVYSTYALFLAAALIFLNAGFDALDGKVARLSKRESKRGDFLDHVLDRYADFFIIGGMTVSPFCDPWIGVLAILGVIFASYMGTQAQAVGIKRDYGGLLGRSDRLVLLIFLPLIQMALEMVKLIGPSHHFPLTVSGFTVQLSVIELMMIWFAIAGNTTAIQRAWASWKELSRREKQSAGDNAQPAPAGPVKAPADPPPETQAIAEREAALASREAELRTMQADLEMLQQAMEERADRMERPGATGTPDVNDTEFGLESGTLSLADATARLRSARLSIEKHMRDLKEKEIRLTKLEAKIARRRQDGGGKP